MKCCAWHDLHPGTGGPCRHASLTELGVRWYSAAGEELCRCGQPLHYPAPALGQLVERAIAFARSLTVRVTSPTGTYELSRHYLALHGLKAWELPELARQGLVTLLEPAPAPRAEGPQP